MASTGYMTGRKQYGRPQAILWSDAPGVLVDGKFIPPGFEQTSVATAEQLQDNSFIILSDHNRSPISIETQRIEQKSRMVNGTMRTYHIADKLTISTSWDMLPSRSFSTRPDFNLTTGEPDIITSKLVDHDKNPNTPEVTRKVSAYASLYQDDQQFTVDGGAGGAELLKWYEEHPGPFWVFLSYDKYTNFGTNDAAYNHLAEYNEMIQMHIASFNYSIVKRGATNFDMWDISVTLEEV